MIGWYINQTVALLLLHIVVHGSSDSSLLAHTAAPAGLFYVGHPGKPDIQGGQLQLIIIIYHLHFILYFPWLSFSQAQLKLQLLL